MIAMATMLASFAERHHVTVSLLLAAALFLLLLPRAAVAAARFLFGCRNDIDNRSNKAYKDGTGTDATVPAEEEDIEAGVPFIDDDDDDDDEILPDLVPNDDESIPGLVPRDQVLFSVLSPHLKIHRTRKPLRLVLSGTAALNAPPPCLELLAAAASAQLGGGSNSVTGSGREE